MPNNNPKNWRRFRKDYSLTLILRKLRKLINAFLTLIIRVTFSITNRRIKIMIPKTVKDRLMNRNSFRISTLSSRTSKASTTSH